MDNSGMHPGAPGEQYVPAGHEHPPSSLTTSAASVASALTTSGVPVSLVPSRVTASTRPASLVPLSATGRNAGHIAGRPGAVTSTGQHAQSAMPLVLQLTTTLF